MTVTGFCARRLDLGLSAAEVSRLSGLSPYLLRRCEEGDLDTVPLYRLVALAECLGISVAEGCSLLELPGRRKGPRQNLLANYMDIQELTLRGMAMLLGVSPQTVCAQCAREQPASKYIRMLAEAESMSVPIFKHLYGREVAPCM